MPKKIKLNLNDLKIQSFVTALNESDRAKIKGGTNTVDEDCDTSTCRTCDSICSCISYCIDCGTTSAPYPCC